MRNEIVVLGGGIAGASVAYYAIKKGFDTLLIEAYDHPNGATPLSGGIITRMQDRIEDILYAVRALKLVNEVVKDDSIVNPGFLSIISQEYIDYELDRYHKAIPDLKILYRDDILERWRYMKIYEDEVGLYTPSDITIDPRRFIMELWNRIQDRGGNILKNSPVDRLKISGERVEGVVLKNGLEVKSENIVVALGAWTKSFLKKHGIKVKTYILSIPIFKFEVDEKVTIGLWDDEAYGYWRSTTDGYIVGGGYDALIVDRPAKGFMTPRQESFQLVKDVFKFRFNFRRWRIVEAWSGPVSFTYNRRPIMKKCNRYKGLYIIDGLGGEGLIRGPGLAYDLIDVLSNEEEL